MNAKVLQALGHPLRVVLLDKLSRQTDSPSQLANCLDTGLSRISYHVTVLRRAGLIEEVETRAARGSIEHFYRASIRDPLRWLPAVLDSKGQEEVEEAIEKSMSAMKLAHKRSARRLAKVGASGLPVTVVVASFEAAHRRTDSPHRL